MALSTTCCSLPSRKPIVPPIEMSIEQLKPPVPVPVVEPDHLYYYRLFREIMIEHQRVDPNIDPIEIWRAWENERPLSFKIWSPREEETFKLYRAYWIKKHRRFA